MVVGYHHFRKPPYDVETIKASFSFCNMAFNSKGRSDGGGKKVAVGKRGWMDGWMGKFYFLQADFGAHFPEKFGHTHIHRNLTVGTPEHDLASKIGISKFPGGFPFSAEPAVSFAGES